MILIVQDQNWWSDNYILLMSARDFSVSRLLLPALSVKCSDTSVLETMRTRTLHATRVYQLTTIGHPALWWTDISPNDTTQNYLLLAHSSVKTIFCSSWKICFRTEQTFVLICAFHFGIHCLVQCTHTVMYEYDFVIYTPPHDFVLV